MNKEFIPYEQALELKELGYNQSGYLNWYNLKGELQWDFEYSESEFSKKCCSAPLYQQAFRFFREKYNLQSCLKLNYDLLDSHILYINGKEINRFTIKNEKWKSWENTESFKKSKSRCKKTYTYEEAELACLKKLIEIVKQTKKD
jgi:hypothetical protein